MCKCYCDAVQYLSQSGECNVVVNSTHSTSNVPWLWYVLQSSLSLVGPRNHLKPVCAIDRPMLWKHCYHFVCFPVVVWSPSVTCLALHKIIWIVLLLKSYPVLLNRNDVYFFVFVVNIFICSISLRAPGILTRVWCIQFYDHLIFLKISLIFVINRCW